MGEAPGAPPEAPPALRVPAWCEIPGLEHGFFGRRGGVSGGDFATLNVSHRIGDDPDAVTENWRRISARCPGLSWVRMHQVHGARVARAETADQPIGEADGLLTTQSGLGLAVLTADCVPMLCVAARERAVMAIHAGWRGTLAGVVEVALAEARHWLGVEPEAWQVALGPAIDGCCYEVEAYVGNQLVERWGAMPEAWQPTGAHGQLDLRSANRQILLAAGVPAAQIATVGPCTACRSAEYFSHRRSHGRAGRQLGVIGWVA
jgi:YfiH family protein